MDSSGSTTDDDFSFAMRLHSELNGPKTQEQLDLELAQAIQNQWNREDDEEEEPEPEEAAALAPESHLSFANQQGITVSKRRNHRDYFLDEIGTFINLEYNAEWQVINVLPDIQLIYNKINENFYNYTLPGFTVMWSEQKVILGENNFKILLSEKQIVLNQKNLLLRPRIDLFSVLIHITIHMYLYKNTSGQHKVEDHDGNFCSMMGHFNRLYRCQINKQHKFLHAGFEYKKQWYRCTGVCINYPPFRGIYRSATGPPSTQNSYWADHESYCGGSFFKLFEIYRDGVGGETERKYVKNAKYMNPKPLAPLRMKTEVAPRELVDLTQDDDAGPARIIPLTDVIDLNETYDFDVDDVEDTSIAKTFISNFMRKHTCASSGILLCPICQLRIFQENFVTHLDGCKGTIQNITFDPTKMSHKRLRVDYGSP